MHIKARACAHMRDSPVHGHSLTLDLRGLENKEKEIDLQETTVVFPMMLQQSHMHAHYLLLLLFPSNLGPSKTSAGLFEDVKQKKSMKL